MNTREPVEITTPGGNVIRADRDPRSGKVLEAKVVHAHSGVICPLDDSTKLDLADLFRVSALQMQAETMCEEARHRIPGGTHMVKTLGENHPGLRPYLEVVHQHEEVAGKAAEAVARLDARVGTAADRIAEAPGNRSGFSRG